jgi:hypothetical protein
VVVAVRAPYVGGKTRIANMSVRDRVQKGLPYLEAYCQFRYSGGIKYNGIVTALAANANHIEKIYLGVWLPSCQEQSIPESAGFAPKLGFNVRPFWAYGDGVDSYALERYVKGLNSKGKVCAIVETTIRKYHVGSNATRPAKRGKSDKCSHGHRHAAGVRSVARVCAFLAMVEVFRRNARSIKAT